MVTVDEIRARVEAADRARIAKRADAAARVVEAVRRRAELATALAEQDAVLTSALADARAVMTDDELVEFTELSATDLPVAPPRGSRRGGSRSGSRKSTTRPRSTARPVTKGTTATASEPVAVGA